MSRLIDSTPWQKPMFINLLAGSRAGPAAGYMLERRFFKHDMFFVYIGMIPSFPAENQQQQKKATFKLVRILFPTSQVRVVPLSFYLSSRFALNKKPSNRPNYIVRLLLAQAEAGPWWPQREGSPGGPRRRSSEGWARGKRPTAQVSVAQRTWK